MGPTRDVQVSVPPGLRSLVQYRNHQMRGAVTPPFRPLCMCCAHACRSQYKLELKVPFPGVGNDLHINMPITVTSGIDTPVLRDQLVAGSSSASGSSNHNILDLPPYVTLLYPVEESRLTDELYD